MDLPLKLLNTILKPFTIISNTWYLASLPATWFDLAKAMALIFKTFGLFGN